MLCISLIQPVLSIKMGSLNSTSFEFRHASIQGGGGYPFGYEPYDKYNGLIAWWQSGEFGLGTTSSPKNVTAVYKSCSQGMWHEHTFPDPVYPNLFWPLPDEDYKKLCSSK